MYFDAHNHLHDGRLAPWKGDWLSVLRSMPIAGAVVNGTREDDWDAVGQLASEHAWVRPSFGLHPWYVPQRSGLWKERLIAQLEQHPGCGVGEIGLDRWIEGFDFPAQLECFRWQFDLAAERNLPATIHCLRAWGALEEILREVRAPERGFLIHAYGGSAEMMRGFLECGAYFSFSPSFLHVRKAAQREVFREVPEDRLLVETDAPDLAPPPEVNPHPLQDAAGKGINHPGNLVVAYEALATLRGWTLAHLQEVVAANFARLFGK